MADVARSLVTATSSSRFVAPNYWRDPKSGNAFQIQVQIPPYRMTSSEEVADLPVMAAGGGVERAPAGGRCGERAVRVGFRRGGSLQHAARRKHDGEYPWRAAWGRVAEELRAAIARAGKPPLGVTRFRAGAGAASRRRRYRA